MTTRVKSGTGSAGSRVGRLLRSSGSSKALILVNTRQDEASASSGDGQQTSSAIGETRLRLKEEQLREEIKRTLTTLNPHTPPYAVEFNFRERCFLPVEPVNHFVTLLSVESACLHRDSNEAQAQLAACLGSGSPTCESPRSMQDAAVSTAVEGDEEEAEEVEQGTEADVTTDAPAEDATASTEVPGQGEAVEGRAAPIQAAGPPKKLTNQFNFCDRAALTCNVSSRELGTQTVPPPRITFSANVTQWVIFDAYQEDFEQQQRERERRERKEKACAGQVPGARREDSAGRIRSAAHAGFDCKINPDDVFFWNCTRTLIIQVVAAGSSSAGAAATGKVERQEGDLVSRQLRVAKIMERMVNQNSYDEITQDFKYWEDPSDEFRDEEGTLLPLWKISYERAKGFSVMSLCWTPNFQDLFAVGMGNFEFQGVQAGGLLCMFTLKTPSQPEFCAELDAGVSSVDIHPRCPNLAAAGLQDGTVLVYDLHYPSQPRHRSPAATSAKHGSAVWQVRWSRDAQDSELCLFSVGGDGKVLCWTVLGQQQHELAQMLVISLSLGQPGQEQPAGSLQQLAGCGTALAFHPRDPLLFLVGTEEGRIYKCSTAYTSIFLACTATAHHMPVHQIDFNHYDPNIYASCSGDWRVKIWEDNRSEPLFEFDLGSPVGDVAWAPYSSTVFAACTTDGRVHVFDLNVNKYRSICCQAVVARKTNRLTRLAFNPRHPVLIVGDNSGCITSLKLSPNLRKKQKPPKKGVVYEHETLEKIKLEKLLALVRDPQNPPTIVETDSTT